MLGFEERLLTKYSGALPVSESTITEELSEDEGDELLGSAHNGQTRPTSSTRLRQMTTSDKPTSRAGGNRPAPPPVPSRKPTTDGSREQATELDQAGVAPPDFSRTRAPSDPFIDPSRSQGSNLSSSPSGISAVTGSGLATPLDPEPGMTPPTPHFRGAGRDSPGPSPRRHTTTLPASSSTPTTPSNTINPFDAKTLPSSASFNSAQLLSLLSEPQIRLWIFPRTYTNSEIHQLLALFPGFISEKAFARFKPVSGGSTKHKSKTNGGKKDLTPRELEEAVGTIVKNDDEGIKVGTGTMRRSEIVRADGWRGSMWNRLMAWFRDLFG